MKILSRYIVKQFLYLFLWSTAAFMGIILISHVFELLRTLLNSKVPFSIAARYFTCLLLSGDMLLQVAPVATLLGVIFCLNQMSRFRELTVMKATGISIYRAIIPLLAAALAVSCCVIMLNEFVAPLSSREAKKLRYFEIDKKQAVVLYSHLSFSEGSRFFYIKDYNSTLKEMKDIQIIQRRSDGSRSISARMDAAGGNWKKLVSGEYEWVLFDVVTRNFSERGELKEMKQSPREALVLQYSPDDFKEAKNPDEMSFSAFLRYMDSLKKSGNFDVRLYVDLFQKISYPLASFFLALAGIPFALRSKRSGIATGFGMSIVIAFVYWAVMSLSLAWGKELLLPPYFAAFLPNIVCLVIGISMLRRIPT